MLLLLCACFVLNGASSFAVERYVEVYDNDSFKKDTFSVGATHSDSGGIFCEALKATYYNEGYKETYYKVYKVQGATELLCGSVSKKVTGSPIVTTKLSSGDLTHAYKRYAYGMTHKTSSETSGIVGSAYITIVRTYPDAQSESGVKEFDTDDGDIEEADYMQDDNLDKENVLVETDNSSEEDVLE